MAQPPAMTTPAPHPSFTEVWKDRLKRHRNSVGGGGGGAVIGFLVAGPVGALIGAGVGYLGAEKWYPTKGVMTAARQRIFDQAVRTLRDPVKLRKLAKSFEDQGLHDQADVLAKKAQKLEDRSVHR